MKLVSVVIFVATLMVASEIFAEGGGVVPPKSFQGIWKVEKVTWRTGNLGRDEDITEGYFTDTFEVRFRRHHSGAIQLYWVDGNGAVIKSRGVTILMLSDDSVRYKEWRAHRLESVTIKLESEEKATMIWEKPKYTEVIELVK